VTRYLILGGGGMLGSDLSAALTGSDVTRLGRDRADVTDIESIRRVAAGHDVIINAAAYTNVDGAEENKEAAHRINAIGAQSVAVVAAENDARLVQVSTDYVFNGVAESPYDESTRPDPQNVYGRTKAEGERLALAANPSRTYVVRTAWLYGAHGRNFAQSMVQQGSKQDDVAVVMDQIGQPSWTRDVADGIVALIKSAAAAGVYHVTNSGRASRFEFAREIFSIRGWDPERIRPVDSRQFAGAAVRPTYSVLGHEKWLAAGLPAMRDWRAALLAADRAGVLESPPIDS
jgi:dTDP-4-dehydrorhamnose reductase